MDEFKLIKDYFDKEINNLVKTISIKNTRHQTTSFFKLKIYFYLFTINILFTSFYIKKIEFF